MARKRLRKKKTGFDNRKETDKVRVPELAAPRSGAGCHGDKTKYKRNPKHKGRDA